MDIAAAIHERRMQLGLSQTGFGDLVGVNTRQVSQWENGKERPSDLKRHALVHKAGIDARYKHDDEVKDPVFGSGEAA